jgi:hypothetical protein
MKDNYRMEYIKFEVADFESLYHAILGRPALAKFMVMPHYVYLLLKMSRLKPKPSNIGIKAVQLQEGDSSKIALI